MIIWINGAFGSGKTQTSYELHSRISNSYVYDPENIGFYISQNIPQSITEGDFQNYPMWRQFNFEMLDYIAKSYNGTIIVPMTITNKEYYNQIIGELSKNYDVKHFILYAERKTLLKRLAKRFENSNSWAAQQIDRCIESFNTEIVETKIKTDEMNIYEVVEKIASMSNLKLLPDSRSRFKKTIDRIITQCKHIR